MDYDIEELSPIEKQVRVQVTAAKVDSAIETIIAQKRKTFEKKGFRKDKVPDNLIFNEQREAIETLAAEQIFDLGIKEARQLYAITPLNRIRVQTDAPLEKGKEFGFRFIIEVLPDLEIPDLRSVEIEVRKVIVTDADIDWIINSLQEQMGTLAVVTEKRSAVDGDVAEFDFESLGEFKAVVGMSGTGHRLELGSGDTIDDFEALLKSLKPTETVTGTVTYPPDFPNPALAGKAVETQVTLNALYRKELPQVDESFARQIARVGTVIEMREILRQRHNHRLNLLYRQDAQRRLLDRLMQQIEVPLSAGFLEQNLEVMLSNYTMAMQQRGMETADIAKMLSEKRVEFQAEAEAAARRQMFLLVVAGQENIKLEPQAVETEIARQADTAGTDPARFLLDARQSGLIRHIEDELMMKKVIDFLYDAATKKPVDEIPA